MDKVALVLGLAGVGLALVSVALFVFYSLLKQFRTLSSKITFVILVIIAFALPTLFILGY